MATYQLISSVTVGSGGASSIDFTSIPATYTDLKLVMSARGASAGGSVIECLVKFNTLTTNQSMRGLYGNGSSAGSQSVTRLPLLANGSGATANTFGNAEMYIPNYAGSTNKSLSQDSASETNATDGWLYMNAGLWSSTAAINQITLYLDSSVNFAQYSTAYLYGIKNS